MVFAAGESDVDFSLIKDTAVKEHAKLQFRAEVFNILNHTNFADVPGRTAFTPTFGRYTSAENPPSDPAGPEVIVLICVHIRTIPPPGQNPLSPLA